MQSSSLYLLPATPALSCLLFLSVPFWWGVIFGVFSSCQIILMDFSEKNFLQNICVLYYHDPHHITNQILKKNKKKIK